VKANRFCSIEIVHNQRNIGATPETADSALFLCAFRSRCNFQNAAARSTTAGFTLQLQQH
jgi:hypothetical protein